MKILQIHNFYQNPGGEDIVLNAEYELLIKNGHDVGQFTVSNDNITISDLASAVNTAMSSIWSRKYYKEVEEKIQKFKPDIVHVHNTFPLLSPSIYWCIKKHEIPIVQTLHNYRLTCANALLMRDQRPCEDCIKQFSLKGIKHKCYRDSYGATGTVVAINTLHRFIKTYKNKIDAYIALTGFAKSVMLRAGLPSEKIYIKPNFILDTPELGTTLERNNTIVFVGRLSEEKGVSLLLEAWQDLSFNSEYQLKIIGDGPEKNILLKKYHGIKNVEWLGWLEKESIFEELKKSKFLVMPSRSYETFGLVLIEAFLNSTPVIATNHAGMPEIVIDGESGFLFNPNDVISLREVLSKAMNLDQNEWHKMSLKAFNSYENKYTAEKNYELLIEIYNEILAKGSK